MLLRGKGGCTSRTRMTPWPPVRVDRASRIKTSHIPFSGKLVGPTYSGHYFFCFHFSLTRDGCRAGYLFSVRPPTSLSISGEHHHRRRHWRRRRQLKELEGSDFISVRRPFVSPTFENRVPAKFGRLIGVSVRVFSYSRHACYC